MKLPLIIGHRGCKHSGIKENSCRAVERSIKERADIVEIDVVCNKKGCFIGHHPKLFSLKNNAESFELLLKTLDSRAMLYVDIKERLSKGKIDALLKLIKKYYKGQAVAGSFYSKVLKCIREKEPAWIINYHCLPTRRCIKKALEAGANWINPVPLGVTSGFVNEAMKNGLKFVPAGNENYKKQLRYAKLGAHALSVFRPALFREWLANNL